jgi:hypothetical protein
VDVGLDVRRGRPGAAPVDDGLRLDRLVGGRDDRGDAALVDLQVHRADLARRLLANPDVAHEEVDHEALPDLAISEVIS